MSNLLFPGFEGSTVKGKTSRNANSKGPARVGGPLHLVAAATATATTSATPRERTRGFRRIAVAGSVRGAKHRQLDRVFLPSAAWAGNFLRLVEHDLLKVGLTVVANVFVDGHRIAPLLPLLSR